MAADREAPLLSVDLLESLRERWARCGAPIAEALNPPASRERIDEVFAGLGLSAPAEAHVWWGWHDGVEGNNRPGPGDMSWPSLDECRKHTLFQRQMVPQQRADTGAAFWGDDWFSLTETIAIATDVPPGAPSPVYLVNWHLVDPPAPPIAQSVGELIGNWIEAIDIGAWWHDEYWRGDKTMVLDRGPRGAWGFY